jgi:peptidoglycan-N-acetylglucosamine deacetylase
MWKKIFPSFIWKINTSEKEVFLTLDDGPTPVVTEWVLDLLKQHQAKATFFCLGKNVQRYPEIYKRILEEGHSVGNHGYEHVKGWITNVDDYLYDIKKAEKLIHSNLFRPAYGKISYKQIKQVKKKFKIIMWDILTRDYNKKQAPENCLNRIIKNVSNGSIIVFHDSLKAEKNLRYALPKAIDYLKKEGYRLEGLDVFGGD